MREWKERSNECVCISQGGRREGVAHERGGREREGERERREREGVCVRERETSCCSVFAVKGTDERTQISSSPSTPLLNLLINPFWPSTSFIRLSQQQRKGEYVRETF